MVQGSPSKIEGPKSNDARDQRESRRRESLIGCAKPFAPTHENRQDGGSCSPGTVSSLVRKKATVRDYSLHNLLFASFVPGKMGRGHPAFVNATAPVLPRRRSVLAKVFTDRGGLASALFIFFAEKLEPSTTRLRVLRSTD